MSNLTGAQAFFFVGPSKKKRWGPELAAFVLMSGLEGGGKKRWQEGREEKGREREASLLSKRP